MMTSQADSAPRAPGNNTGMVKPFLEHLNDLRRTIVKSLIVFVVASVLVVPWAPDILDIVEMPLADAGRDPELLLRTLEVTGGFMISVHIVLLTGLTVSLPFMAFFIAEFIFPGLSLHERRVVVRTLSVAVLLFACGVLLCYAITLPLALKVMFRTSEWLGVTPGPIRINSYVSFCMHLMLGFGIAFELPVLLIVLGRLGLVSSEQLADKRRHVVIALLILAMLLTPPDVFTQLIMAVPLIVLYELSLQIMRVSEYRNRGRVSKANEHETTETR